MEFKHTPSKKHLTTDKGIFLTRNQCPIPHSLYSQDIVYDFLKSLILFGIKPERKDFSARESLLKLPYKPEELNRPDTSL